MTEPRLRPPIGPDERAVLHGWLRFNRQTVEIKCRGLGAEQLVMRSVAPSPFSLLGLVQHLHNLEVSRLLWFGEVRVQMPYLNRRRFEVDEADVEETFVAWRADCERADRVIESASSMDDAGPPRPALDESRFAVWNASSDGLPGPSLRALLTDLNYEYARHAGHMDLLRERIDGQTGY